MARKKVSRKKAAKECMHCSPEGARLVKWATEWAEGSDEELLLANGFEEAIIGVTFGYSENKIIYDYDKCVEILMRDMSQEDAIEHMSFNVTCAYVGEHTPIFIKLADNNGSWD